MMTLKEAQAELQRHNFDFFMDDSPARKSSHVRGLMIVIRFARIPPA